ncbi:hypothetical protein BCR36DRAFT_415593 [Piromyces finnis]|uniref:Uncharacterized protein n=1 Tax=Piromyces finnis TaxID=1754191 RepID=A0A1Y1UYC2_9FUNG|nr:hypothetical protein BCR36DRAFT_415593 [Piromyces finnis]|eukprot:ORX43413.1 hypothetical protein BCR36DRAFT_415593 [Piromyces finnis]
MDAELKIEELKELISNNQKLYLEDFFDVHSNYFEDLNNFNEILIYTIECATASTKILKYIINLREDKNLNYYILTKPTEDSESNNESNTKIKIPLFEAVKNNFFDKANILISYKADKVDINYSYQQNIFDYLYNSKCLSTKTLKYILSSKYNITLSII